MGDNTTATTYSIDSDERASYAQLQSAPKGYRSPALRLPPELLVLIFREVQVCFNCRPHGCAHCWLRVTWVCRYWREVALSTPALWTSISSISACKRRQRAQLATTLERAAEMPLDVDLAISDHGERAPSLLASLFVHAHKFRTLRLELGNYSPCQGSMQPFFELMTPNQLSMPWLEDFHLHDSVWAFTEFHRPYLSQLTHEHVPRLRNLSLTCVNLPWSSPVYSSLSTLDLDSIPAPPTIEEFVQILRSCPALQQLRISNTLPVDDLAEQLLPSDTSVIALPHLNTLHLDGEYAVVAYICDLLEVPSLCEVNIDYSNVIESNPPLGLVSAVLPRQRAFREAVLHANFFALTSENTQGYGNSYASFEINTPEGEGPLIYIDSECASDADMDATSWQDLLYTFRSAPLTRVCISPVDHITVEMWIALFRQAPLLDIIEVGPERGFLYKEDRETEYMRHSIKPLLYALQASEPDIEHIYVPNLRCLVMNILVADFDIAVHIVCLLEERRALGKPMERLEFRDSVCQADIGRESFMSQLQEAGVNVVTFASSTVMVEKIIETLAERLPCVELHARA
ncbi:hypothetical protein C8Q73DRAFT_285588 [Cubamyces lactineus]|nr:hypothetical protein C8Q73DRAFT_285588 [Cubamyces lactineus]